MKTHIAAKTFYLEGSAGQYNTDVLKDEGLRAEIRDILYEFAGEEKLREFDAFTQQYRQPQTPSPSTTPPRSSRRPRF